MGAFQGMGITLSSSRLSYPHPYRITYSSVSFLLIPHISLAKSLISVDRDGLHVSSQTF
jgi:hypothetical protein